MSEPKNVSISHNMGTWHICRVNLFPIFYPVLYAWWTLHSKESQQDEKCHTWSLWYQHTQQNPRESGDIFPRAMQGHFPHLFLLRKKQTTWCRRWTLSYLSSAILSSFQQVCVHILCQEAQVPHRGWLFHSAYLVHVQTIFSFLSFSSPFFWGGGQLMLSIHTLNSKLYKVAMMIK